MGPWTSSCCLFGRSSVQECWNRGPGVATLCSCWPRRDKGTEEEEEAEEEGREFGEEAEAEDGEEGEVEIREEPLRP